MRELILFIAMSLDGYIADRTGGVGWLPELSQGVECPDPYTALTREIDTVLLGWNTYRQIRSELSPDVWVYRDFTSYVFTRRTPPPEAHIHFTGESPCTLAARLKRASGKGIWVCGGAHLAQQLMAADLIDRYHISVIPTLLGDGIPLFGKLEQERKLTLLKAQTYCGITDLVFVRRR